MQSAGPGSTATGPCGPKRVLPPSSSIPIWEAWCCPGGGVVLLEDLGNLAANELYSPAGAGEEGALDAILEGIGKLRAQCRALVVVSNEIFAGGRDYAPGTEAYLSLMARAHRAIAARADQVYEVVCGLPFGYKGVTK